MDSRRRPQKTPNARRLTRKNSSFLASVKSFVAAPLSRFFSGTDEFDDSKDEMGKRRRLEGAQNEPAVAAMDDGPAPTKKLRRLSPDRQPQPRLNAYLDPPQSAFASQPMPQLNQDYSRLLSLNTHHPTIEIPRNEPRTTLSPLRNQLSRTMSIDPPQSSGMSKRLSRDVSMRNISSFIPRDESMEPAPASSLIRPASMSARDTPLPRAGSSFRMRTSLTPQPSREFSEPPSLAALGSKPVFVRAPPAEPASKHVPTLGALVESKRSTQSPVRQSSAASLLFGTHSLPPRARPLSTAERIFQDLDAYKTPLKPTRVRENRSQSAFGTDVTDMFSRKKSYQRMPGARGMDAKTQNKTKPYAGQAGIRKHLARSRLALAEEQQVSERAETSGNRDDDMATEPRESTPEPLKDLKLPEDKGGTFKPVPKTTIPSQSSLRVGRTFTSRNHIERPARAGKSKFSASFDEDEEESEESQKERAAMEEAAKNVPVFNIPTGFSFAKDNVPAPSLTETASASAEPPIPTLPFSFAVPKTTDAPSIVPAAAPSSPETQQPTANEGAPTAASDNATPKPSGIPDFFGVNKSTPMPVHPTPSPSFVPSPAVEPPKASGSTFTFGPTTPPAVASETKVAEPTKTFTFGLPAPAPTTASTTTDKPAAAAFTFGGPTAGGSLFGQKSGTETTTTPFLFGKPPAVTTPPTDKPAESSSSEPQKAAQSLFGAPAPTPSQTSFSFGQPTTEPPKTFSFGATQPTQPSSTLFSFGGPKPTSTVEPSAPTSTPAPATAPSIPFTFGVPASQPAQVETAPKLTFGGFGQSTQADDAPTKSFSFGPASAAPKDEAPKSAFPFGAPAASAVNAPFSFTTTPSTPLSDAGEKKGFSFGTTTPGPSSPSPSFSFGGGSTSTEAPKPFAFGTSAPARPVTPPNQDTDLNMDESPTREMTFSDAPKIAEPRPTLGFSFGTSLNTSGFGAQPSGSAVSTPTGAFGQPSSNPFGKASEKPEERKSGFGGGFGQMNGGSGSGFPFGGRKVEEPPRPATAGSFPFSSPSSATNPSAPFSFGGSANNSTGSTGFPSAPLSAPNSPSTFGNTATASPSFAFGALPITTNPFGFGSQPASPAPGTSSLPSAGFGSGGGGFGGPAPVTNGGLFGGSGAPTSAGASGGGMFTIGAAPVAPSGSRQIKKLPTRRGGAKR